MNLRPGHVIRLLDEGTRPEKIKRHICVCPERRLFLRINSQPLYRPHHEIDEHTCPGIVDHKSYVELRALYRHSRMSLQRDWARPDNPIGIISGSVAYAIATAADRADTINEEQRYLIWQNFNNLF